MRNNKIQFSFYHCLGVAQWVAGIIVIVVPIALKIDLSKVELKAPILVPFLGYLQQDAWILIPIFASVGGLCRFWQREIGPPWVWENVKLLLDAFQRCVFKGTSGDQHHHRATLFMYRKKWDLERPLHKRKGVLEAVARSGHTTQDSKVIFKAPDRADEAEGVAGRTWARREVVYVRDLPDLKSVNCTEEDFKTYADASWISLDKVKKQKPCSRSLCGLHVEVKGKIWGVIVLDSRLQSLASKKQLINEFYSNSGKFLGKLLEKV